MNKEKENNNPGIRRGKTINPPKPDHHQPQEREVITSINTDINDTTS